MKKYLNGTLLGVLLLVLSGCQKEIPNYRGYYFDAMIEDARVIELKDSSKIPALNSYVREVHWQLDRPINGNIGVKYGENKNSKNFIGRITKREAMGIVPLQSTNLSTNPTLKSDSSVRINGGAAVSKVDTLKKNVLPVGDYVLRLKVHGTNNWDRKEIYVQVR